MATKVNFKDISIKLWKGNSQDFLQKYVRCGDGLASSYWGYEGVYNITNAKDTVYGIFYRGNIVGFIDCKTISVYKNKGHVQLYIDMVEIFGKYQGHGIGRALVQNLFLNGQVYFGKRIMSISGESLASAIDFWYSLGSKFYVSDSKLEYYKEECESAAFVLSLRGFNNRKNF